MIINKKKILLIIALGFLLSVFQINNHLDKYDKNLIGPSGNNYHQMIKADPLRYMSHGNKIKDQLKDGINFFETGNEHFTKYLPARIAALYYYITDNELYSSSDKNEINLGIHFNYLFFQSLFYFLSLILLYFSLNKSYDNKICFYLIFFLSFEPTINQYHASFWSESYLLTIVILLTSLILKYNLKGSTFLLIGIFLGLLALQKEYLIFYIIAVITFFILFYKKKIFKNIFLILCGFAIILCILGFNNYKRSGSFYILTATTKLSLLTHLVRPVINNKDNLVGNEFYENYEGVAAKKWLEENSVSYSEEILNSYKYKGPSQYRLAIINEKDKIKFDEYFFKRTINYITDYPLEFGFHILKKSIHFTLLNPFHIYSDNNFISGETYYYSDLHDELVKYRVLYTLLIYLICFVGLISLIRKKNYKLLFFISSSVLFFFMPISWIGNTRNFVPCLIFISFLFSFGLNAILKMFKSKDR